MHKVLRNSATIVLALALMSNVVGCSDEEVAQSLGAAAIIAGAIAIAATTPPAVCVSGYRTVCHQYVDYYGIEHNECENVYDSCINQYLQEDVALNSGSATTTPDVSVVNAVSWGQTFNVGYEGSDKLISALKEAQGGKLQPILDLGLNKDDVKRLAQFKLPSTQGNDALAKTLNTDSATTQAMLKQILTIAKKQKQAQDGASLN